MILVDANLLLYAYNPSLERHVAAKTWIEGLFSGPETVALPWPVLLAFLRIVTNPRAFERPLAIDEARSIVEEWLGLPTVVVPNPGERHWAILSSLLDTTRPRGALVMDAHLAALAIEHAAELCSTDRDFSRFPGLRWRNPLAS